MELMKAAVHARHEITIVFHAIAPRQEQMGASIAVYNFPCFRRHENGIKTVSLAAVELYPAIMHAVGWEGKQVTNINAEQTEGETEAVEIALLPRLDVEGKERTKFIQREVTLGCFNATDLEFTERIKGCQFLVDGIVENRTDIAQVYVAGIDRRRLNRKMKEEGAQPVGGNLWECELRGGRVELRDALPCGFIDFTRAAVFNAGHKRRESVKERHRFGVGGRGGGKHEVTEFPGREVGTEVRRHKNGLKQAVPVAETVEQVIIQGFTVGTYTHAGTHRVPFRGQDGLGQGNEGGRAVMVDLNAEGTRAVMLWTAGVEV